MSYLVNKITFDSHYSRTELCNNGVESRTDKCPWISTDDEIKWRHSYTPFYNLLFSPFRYKEINFGEIGILKNASICMWRKYFSNANIYGWDVNPELINNAKSHNLSNVHYDIMDASSVESIDSVMSNYNCMFDIIIEDGSHYIEHQTAAIKSLFKYLKPGGILVIEDLDRVGGHSDDHYVNQFFNDNCKDYYESITIVETNHASRSTFTGTYDNEKLLYMVRNSLPYNG
jgi:SAM-dependent methyltransferase